jgi:hypothetical protein
VEGYEVMIPGQPPPTGGPQGPTPFGAVPMTSLVIPLSGVPLSVKESPTPDAAAHLIVGPMVIQFVLPLTQPGAQAIATALQARASGIAMPNDGVPPSVG